MQSQSVSLIIPVFDLSGDRLRNFEFNLERAKSAPFVDIIVVEQVKDINKESPLSNIPGIRYLPIISDCEVIEKSKLINAGALASNADFIWINDADIYCQFSQVLDILKPYHIVVRPFKYFVKLNEAETQAFLKDRKVSAYSKYMNGLCAGSFIIRRNEFAKIRGMDERYRGWGYEDMEIALRITNTYPIEHYVQFRGVHLNHKKEVSKNATEYTARNLQIFTDAKAIVAEDVLDQVNKVVSPFPKNGIWQTRSGNIVHVVNPCLSTKNPNLLHRQLLAISSINKSDDRGIIKIAAITRDEFEVSKNHTMIADWEKVCLTRDSSDIGHTRRLPFLLELLDIARKYAKPEDFIVISNSDCGITRQFYRGLLNTPEDYVEYFRVNVYNPSTVEDLYTNDLSRTFEEQNGIDAFAIRASLFDEIRENIPDMMLGEPYWDPVISGLMKKRNDIVQNCYDLRHPDHRQQWDLNRLTIGGEYNKKGWQRTFEDGLMDIKKCEIIRDTIVIRIHNEKTTNYAHAAKAYKNLKEQDLSVNYVFIDVLNSKKQSNIRDDDIGTTGGKRLIWYNREVNAQLSFNELVKDAVEKCPKARFIICLEEHALTDDAGALRKIVQQLRENPEKMIQDNCGFTSSRKHTSIRKNLVTAMTRTKFKSIIESSSDKIIDTAVIIATFGHDQLRIAANIYAFRQLQKQSLKVKYVWVEMLSEGERSHLPLDIRKNVEYIAIRSCPKNERLFQKEALWNLAVKKLKDDIRFLYFFDSDIYCDKINWFAKIREMLDFDENCIVQPGTEVVTLKMDGPAEIMRAQMTWVGHDEVKPSKQYNFNPGLAVCMTRKLYDAIGGFNPYGVMYGGDTIFLIETCKNSHPYYRHLMNNSSMRHVIRKDILNSNVRITWKGVDNYITHVWHGHESNRTYWVWEHFLTLINFNAKEMLQVDEQGLLAWKENYPLFNFIHDQKSLLTDKFICKRLIREFYDVNEKSSNVRTIFTPSNFGVEVWTMNVARTSNEIPRSSDNTDTFLRLKGEIKNKASNGFVGVISFSPHYVTMDATEMEPASLVFEARALRVPGNDILISLQSKEDDAEKALESSRLNVSQYANVTDQWTVVRIPIKDFDIVNKARLYAIVIKGVGEFTLDIRSMKVES